MGGVIVLNKLSSEIVNSDGYSAVFQQGDALAGDASGVLLAGTDGYVVSFIKTSADGTLQVELTGSTPQPITGSVVSTQGGLWYVRLHDGYGNPALISASTPQPNDPGLVVRVVSSSSDGYLEALVEQGAPETAVRTTIANTTTPTTLLALNSLRKGATIYNTSNRLLYIGFGATTVTTADFTVQISSGGYYEIPYGFTGRISGVWSATGSGGAVVTELS